MKLPIQISQCPNGVSQGLWVALLPDIQYSRHELAARYILICHDAWLQMYTDIKAELEDVQGAFCPGLEAPFGQLNLAFKRITVPNFLNPDGSIPPSTHPGLPWWDMMGYMWRGVASVRIRELTAVLANTQNPHVGVRDEKLALTAATLSIAIAAGKIDVTTTNMSALAHAAVPDAGPGEHHISLYTHSASLDVITCKQQH